MALWKENPTPTTAAAAKPAAAGASTARPAPAPDEAARPMSGGLAAKLEEVARVAQGAAQGGLAAKPTEPPAPVLRYIDRPECDETFADSVTQVYFDGQTLRIELCVTRLDEIKPNAPITGRRMPAQRLALTPNAAVELINRMQQVATALTQAGVLKSANNKPQG